MTAQIVNIIDGDKRIETFINRLNEVVDEFRDQGLTAATAIGAIEIVKQMVLKEIV